MSDWKQAIAEEQKDMSREEVLEEMKRRSDSVIDLDNLQPQQHNWVMRGMKATCEGATHPYHEAWFRSKI